MPTYTHTEARHILNAHRDLRPTAINAMHRLRADGATNRTIAKHLGTATPNALGAFLNRTTPNPAHPDHAPGRTPEETIAHYGYLTHRLIDAMSALRDYGETYRAIAAHAGYANASVVYNRLHTPTRQHRI